MIVERKIKIDNKKYLIGIELYYENKKVCKKSDKFNKYFDFGDLRYAVEWCCSGFCFAETEKLGQSS